VATCFTSPRRAEKGAAIVSTFWRYVRVQAFVFSCGIVGPIFLVVYFAAQPEPTLKWMYWAGLFVTAIDVLIALALANAAATDDSGRKASRKSGRRG
jgi:hypothetical protein